MLFARDESRMAFYVNDSRTPSDLFVSSIGGEPVRLTRSLNPKIDPAHLVDAQVVRFDSYDGVEMPGILYPDGRRTPGRPARASRAEPARPAPAAVTSTAASPGRCLPTRPPRPVRP